MTKLTRLQYALVLLNVIFRLYSALYMIIGDCDETFNYWEPLNLLLRGFGKQTWEYSPEFSIRSYAYLVPYYIVGKACQFLAGVSPVNIFYAVRIVALAGITSLCELKFFVTMNQFSTSVANWCIFLSTISPGMSHGGVALLPSSLALQTTLLANSYLLSATKSVQNKSVERNLIKAVGCYFIGGILGWPFALALGLPIGLYILARIAKQSTSPSVLVSVFVVAISIMVPVVLIDSYFLQKWVFIPANIVLYNVFGGDGEGPEIFGVEPWTYYVLNMALNFHAIVPLSIAGTLFNPVFTNLKKFSLLVSLQLIIWYAIFFSQPHKEERFMYPIYPLVSISAAIFISKVFNVLKKISVARRLQFVAKIATVLLLFTISVLRIFNLVENYAAPLQVFYKLAQLPSIPGDSVNICMGKEWYHFPNSFFLPDGYRLQFVESGFDGLLPGDFYESKSIVDSTTFVPMNMNNKNKFEPDKVVDLATCDYYVDNSQSESTPQLLNPDLSVDNEWDVLQCDKLLNPHGSHNMLGKMLYIPTPLRKWIPYNVEYMQFCILKNRIEKQHP
ncbi:mannosyltransferase [Lodderomyces elongisporus]|uniref:mannosyltransferase n=1 Tax=Lodderomyces elongisporus TaxID=36914 RepID=UPI0029217100|nr:mannosyltransferase [Lodderomyces elongisporus]WLF76848.1 mannosyltransferase [Lodderomyces elongisporus]